jgi:hypothetical protein
VNWHLHEVYAGEIDLALILFSNYTWLNLTGYFNSWHKTSVCGIIATGLIHDMPWHDLLDDVDVSKQQLRLLETFFSETINSHWYVMYMDILNACPITKELCLFSHLDSATSHTANNSLHYLEVLLVTQQLRWSSG